VKSRFTGTASSSRLDLWVDAHMELDDDRPLYVAAFTTASSGDAEDARVSY